MRIAALIIISTFGVFLFFPLGWETFSSGFLDWTSTQNHVAGQAFAVRNATRVVPSNYCKDTDNGMDFSVQGTCTNRTGEYTDFCADSGTADWWDPAWQFRKRITIINNNPMEDLSSDYTVTVNFDHYALVNSGKSLPNGNDVRVIFHNRELNRVNITSFGRDDTIIEFMVQETIPPAGNDSDYWVYYGNQYAGEPPTDGEDVYLFSWNKRDLSQFNIVQLPPEVIDNEIVFDGGSCCTFQKIQTLQTFTRPIRIGVNWRTNQDMRYGQKSGTPYTFVIGFHKGVDGEGYNFYANEGYGWGINVLGIPPFVSQEGGTLVNTIYRNEIILDQTYVTFNIYNETDGKRVVSLDGMPTFYDGLPLHIGQFDNLPESQYIFVTEVTARKYTTPEPNTSIGFEEQLNNSLVEYSCSQDKCVDTTFDCSSIGMICQDGTCVTPPSHLVCVNLQCVVVSGSGTDECLISSDCSRHLECVSNTCSIVPGVGNDSCFSQGSLCGPDLTVTNLTATIENVTNSTNKTVTLKAIIKNVGQGAANWSTTGFDVTPFGGIQDIFTPMLQPNQNTSVEVVYILPVGNYNATATADVFNNVTESNENNNDMSINFLV